MATVKRRPVNRRSRKMDGFCEQTGASHSKLMDLVNILSVN